MPKLSGGEEPQSSFCAENSDTSTDSEPPCTASDGTSKMDIHKNRNWRFREAYDKHRLATKETMQQFAIRSGIGTVWAVTQLLSGRRPLTLDAAYKVAKAMDIPINEIIDEAKTKLILDCFASLDPKIIVTSNRRLAVSLFTPIQALNIALGKTAEPCGKIQTDYAPDRNLVALSVQNEEMAPRLKPNDIVIVELKKKPQPKDIVLVKVPGLEKALLREYIILGFDRCGKPIFELRTTDQDYPKYTSEMEDVEVLGVVIERRTLRLEDR